MYHVQKYCATDKNAEKFIRTKKKQNPSMFEISICHTLFIVSSETKKIITCV